MYTGYRDGRIVRFNADGMHEEFVDTGGFPLGMRFDSDGNLIVADADKPFVRKLLGALPPSRLTPSGSRAFVLGLDSDGEVIYNLQGPNSEFSTTTSAVRNGKRLYICSLTADAVGVLELP